MGTSAMLRGLLDQSRDGLVALDGHGTIVEANLAAAAILGHKRSHLVGKPLAALVALDDRKVFRHTLDHVTSAGENLELRLHGESEPWAVVLRALPRVQPRTIVASLTPRTERQQRRKQQQQERRETRIEHFALRFPHAVVALHRNGTVALANTNARSLLGHDAVRTGMVFGEGVPPALRSLARRLIEIPAPLHPTNVDLADGTVLRVSGLSYAMDEPAILFLEDVTAQHRHERVTRDFLRNAAHQLRTPLAGIAAAIETLQGGAKERPADRDRFLEHLESHAARMGRIARGLLLLARAQTSEQLLVDYIEIGPLLDQAAAAVEPREGVEIATVYERGLAVLASPELLQETLAALVENAVSYTDRGSVRLEATSENGQVAVSVADSGRGILPEFRDRIFEPFYRVGDRGKGYGLGLAIAAQAVQAMEGTIEVSDTPGGGTTFTVRLRSMPR